MPAVSIRKQVDLDHAVMKSSSGFKRLVSHMLGPKPSIV